MPSPRFLSAFTAFLLLLQVASRVSAASVFNCQGGSVYVVAHPDDDLLFQSPDLQTDVSGNNCITAVFLTSGDSGTTTGYAQSRESGNAAAYAEMAGVANSYTSVTATLAGQPVLVQTLVGAPQIQRVLFRLPDGNMDGSGYPSTGYTSLRQLYFGSISSIRNTAGTATFTLSTLKQAISEIVTSRSPNQVRTLDYLSQYDSGDHADHLTTARIVQGLVGSVAPDAGFAGYIGYGVSNYPPTMSTSDPAFTAKSNAFFAYAPYDTAECQSYSACVSAGRGESYWLTRQYQTSAALAFESYDGSAQSPVSLPNGTNVAPLGTVYASSSYPNYTPYAAVDGNIGGYPGNASAEWVSNGETTTAWWGVAWDQPYTIDSIVLYDRPNTYDWMTGCTLTFSDGSSVSVGALANDGSATLVSLPGTVVTQMIVLAVTSTSSSTSNIGLSEFQAYGTICSGCSLGNNFTNASATTTTSGGVVTGTGAFADLALLATATASSYGSSQPPDRANDGVISGYPANYSAEWAANGQTTGAWLNLTWDAYYLVDSVVLYDRPNTNDWITGGTIQFDDGTSLPITSLDNAGGPTVFNLSTPANMSSLQFTVTSASSSSSNVGLAEIVVSYSQPQTPTLKSNTTSPVVVAPPAPSFDTTTDLALNATASASTSSPNQGPSKAIDGQIGGYTDAGGDYTQEWASAGEGAGAWFKLTWPYGITVEQVVLYDRPNLNDQVTGGTLRFDNGLIIQTGSLVNDGSATNISIPSINTTSIFFTVTSVSPTTGNVGLSEFAVYGSINPISNTTTGTNSTANSTIVAGSSSLPVPTTTDLALNATIYGSSASPNQGPEKAIDGVINGYKEDGTGDYTKEWASNHEGVGASLYLAWASSINVSTVVLYDRPNLGDQVTSGTLKFSDGSTYQVGTLPNNGSAFVVPINNVATTSLSFSVTGVSSTTSNIGLAEIAVYGTPPSVNTTIISNSTVISNSTIIGNGTIITNGTLIGNGTFIGNGTLLNNGTIMNTNGTLLTNGTLIGNGTFIGNGTLLNNGTFIGNGTIIPNNGTLADNSTLPMNGTLASNGTIISNSTTLLPNGTIIANSTTLLPNGTIVSNSTLLPNGTIDSNSTSLLPNGTISSNSTTLLPNGTVISNSTALLPNGTIISNSTTLLPNGTIISNSTLPSNSSTSLNGTAIIGSNSTIGTNSSSSLLPNASMTLNVSSSLPSATPNASVSVNISSFFPSSTPSSNSASSSALPTNASISAGVSASSSASASSTISSSASSAQANSTSSGPVSTGSSSGLSSSSVVSSSSSAALNSSSAASSTSTKSSSALPSSSSTALSSSSSSIQPSSSIKPSSSSVSSAAKAPSTSSSSSSIVPSTSSKAVVTSAPSSTLSSSSTKMVTSSKASSTSSAPAGLPTAPATGASINIARLGVATASSSNAKSPASGVNDGVVGGVSLLGLGNPANEWAASGTSSQWVQIDWTKQYLMREVILYGRVNGLNTVTSGVLSFSDGTVVKVSGSISSAGSVVSLGSGIYSSSVRFTTAGTSLTSTSVGLAEMAIYNAVPPTTGLVGTLGNAVGNTLTSLLNSLGF